MLFQTGDDLVIFYDVKYFFVHMAFLKNEICCQCSLTNTRSYRGL